MSEPEPANSQQGSHSQTQSQSQSQPGPTSSQLDNKQIFSLLLHPEYRHYFGFESVLSVMSNAAVSMGLESVVESWVSVMEHHNNPNRALSQDR